MRPTRSYWRLFHLCGFLFAAFMLSGAVYLQLVEFVMPCLFCVYIRLVTVAYGVISLIAVLHEPVGFGRRLYAWLLSILCLVGIALSAYLIWLQEQPLNAATSCGQGIGASLIHWPFGETLVLLFSAYGECAQAQPWTILGLSIPVLGLLGFIALFVFEIGKRIILAGANE